jgi:predicted RNA binding protein YcfA (HicA-like mRNA interferase family)
MPKNNVVTTRDLVSVLRALNFVERERRGSHVMFAHKDKGVVVTVPTSRQFVPLVHLRAIEKSLEGFNIISSAKFEKKLGVHM